MWKLLILSGKSSPLYFSHLLNSKFIVCLVSRRLQRGFSKLFRIHMQYLHWTPRTPSRQQRTSKSFILHYAIDLPSTLSIQTTYITRKYKNIYSSFFEGVTFDSGHFLCLVFSVDCCLIAKVTNRHTLFGQIEINKSSSLVVWRNFKCSKVINYSVFCLTANVSKCQRNCLHRKRMHSLWFAVFNGISTENAKIIWSNLRQ